MEPDLQPPSGAQISAAEPPEVEATAAEPSPDPAPIEDPPITVAPTINPPPKRQRRPSVRLGEIGGEPPHETHQRRPSKTWRFHKDPSLAAKSSRTRPLTNLVNGGSDSNFNDSVEISDNYADFGHRKAKIRKPARKTRTNWNKFDSVNNNNGNNTVAIGSPNLLQEEEEGDGNNNNLEFRELEAAENSESPMLREHRSPINSGENMGLQFWDQHRNGLHQNEANSVENQNGGSVGVRVREWLIGLGLGRYAPVFEIHEVDEEVLPMLTVEDLKDMGINAVGSRRKMYSAILKLRKGMSSIH